MNKTAILEILEDKLKLMEYKKECYGVILESEAKCIIDFINNSQTQLSNKEAIIKEALDFIRTKYIKTAGDMKIVESILDKANNKGGDC